MLGALIHGALADVRPGAQPPLDSAVIRAPDDAAARRFGASLAVAGDVAAIGSPYDTPDDAAGRVHIYRHDAAMAAWVHEATLRPADAAAGDWFGHAVAAAGDAILVGAFGSDTRGEDSGAAFIFRFEPETRGWRLEAELHAHDGAPGDVFGHAVALAGDVAVIGAWRDDDRGDDSGAAYVFRYHPEKRAWRQEAKLLPDDAAAGDRFGRAVAIAGDTIIVGAPEANDRGEDSGSAYVFRFDPETRRWTRHARLHAADGDAFDWFGYSAAIEDDVAVIGAWRDDRDGFWHGSAYVFRCVNGDWRQEAKLEASDATIENDFARSIALSDDTVLIGAGWDDPHGPESGSAYLFRFDRARGRWIERAKLTSPRGAAGDCFGRAVALERELALIAAPAADGAGRVYVFLSIADHLCAALPATQTVHDSSSEAHTHVTPTAQAAPHSP